MTSTVFLDVNSIWTTSIALQWGALLVLILLVFSLMCQMAKLAKKHDRIPSRDEIYAHFGQLPAFDVKLANGETARVGGSQAAPCLLLFFAPKCGACHLLPEAIRDFIKTRSSPAFNFLAVIDIGHAAVSKYIADKSLESVPAAILTEFPRHLRPGGAPFAVAIAADGRITAVGKPKCLSHLLEMAASADNLAGLVRRRHAWGESVPYLSPAQIAARQAVAAVPARTL